MKANGVGRGMVGAWLLFSCAVGWAAGTNTSGTPAKLKPPLEQRIKHPVDWLEWGADLRLRDEGTINSATLQNGTPNSEANYLRMRPRIWTLVTPVPDVTLDLRFIAEPKYYFQPANKRGWNSEEGLFDHGSVQFTNLLDHALTITVGRQEFNFGNKWLIFDGTSVDGSRSEYFDAARITYDSTALQTTFDAIYVEQSADTASWLPVLNRQNLYVAEQDERGGILYVRNHSLPKTQVEGYAIFRHQEAVLPQGNSGDTWLVGARVEGKVGERWQYRTEFAPEFGRLNGADVRAWGCNSLVTFNAGGSWKTRLRVGYEYLSGDDRASAANEGWDAMWARRATWSELMVYVFAAENRTRAADYKNLQRPSIGFSLNPVSKLELSADYSPLFANENTYAGTTGYSNDGRFRGHYVQGIARYTLSRNWSALLWGEFFLPGDYYAPQRRDLAMFFRSEISFKF